MEALGGTASVIAVVDIAGKVLSLCWKYYSAVKDAKTDIDRLCDEIKAVQEVFQKAQELAKGPQAVKLLASRPLIEKIPSQLKDEFGRLEDRLNLGKTKKTMQHFGLRALKWPLTSQDVDKTVRVLERYKATLSTALAADLTWSLKRNMNLIEEDRLLTKLPYAEGAAYNSRLREHEDPCLPDTRVELLQQIMAWDEDPSGAYIFWLNGMAGTGKSTIARTVARDFADKKRVVASFFFSRGGGDVSHAGKFFTSIAVQLASKSPFLKRLICEAIAEHNDIAGQALYDQWNQLVLRPLSRLEDKSPLILVVDALDECDGENDIRRILQLLTEASSLKTTRFRVFITSRPETPIRLGFRGMSGILHHDLVLHNISRAVVNHDISVFFKHMFGRIKDDFEDLPEDWPGNETINSLVQNADGLFIYAATVCRFIKGDEQRSPRDLLDSFVASNVTKDFLKQTHSEISCRSPMRELDKTYMQILQHSFSGVEDKEDISQLAKSFRWIIGSITILSEPLSAVALAKVLAVRKDIINLRLRHLHSVLDVPKDQDQPIRLLHPSLRDFLLDKERCCDQQFWVDERKTHETLAQSCLQLMFRSLKRDICGLHAPGTLASAVKTSRREQYLPPDLQYACRYWVPHLQRSEARLVDGCEIHKFLQKHFLHWLEALSLIGKTSDSVQMVANLQSMVADGNRDLLAMVHDARRFILYNRSIIEESPLQTYCSALVFAPKKSAVRRQFLDHFPQWICRLPEVQDDWSPCLQTLEGHSSSVRSVAFSHDDKQLASASDDGTVKIWDTTSGKCLQTLEGHSREVWSVAFSHDDKQLASTSGDGTIKIWDTASGKYLQMLEGHSSSVWSVTFSHDDKQLASASGDRTIKIWDTASGKCLQTLEGHSSSVWSVAFSHDNRQLASASADGTVKIWDTTSSKCLQTLEGHSGSVWSVAFSHDDKQLASASDDETVKIWDTALGKCLQTLEDHSRSVWSVAFSHDDKQLASVSDDRIVKIWDTASGKCLQTLEGHNRLVWSVAFSHDDKRLASASDDGTVKIWDTALGKCLQTPEGHSSSVRSVTFSHDDKQLASASGDGTIKIWDTASGKCLQTLEGHSSSVWSVAFSHDDKQLASASADRTVKIWDTASGKCLQTLDVNTILYNISFDAADQSLCTDIGIIVLDVSSASGTAPSRSAYQKPRRRGYGVSSDRTWVIYNSENLLWLPSEYRPSCSAVTASTVAIGCGSGWVLIFNFMIPS